MSEPVRIGVEIPDNVPKDIEFMAALSKLAERYAPEMEFYQFVDAVDWFHEAMRKERKP